MNFQKCQHEIHIQNSIAFINNVYNLLATEKQGPLPNRNPWLLCKMKSSPHSLHLPSHQQIPTSRLMPVERVNQWPCANAVIVILKSRVVFCSLCNAQIGLQIHIGFISTSSLLSVLDCPGRVNVSLIKDNGKIVIVT